ncbi:MAG: hypothetical protein EXR12_09255 [Rhodospirillaceae bacterium]|nr:hypothetical protein [Rhodospirillaceae bacterium]
MRVVAPVVLATALLILIGGELASQTAAPAPKDAATLPATPATPVEAGIIVVEFEIKEEQKSRDDLVKKVEKLPPAQRIQAADELKWAAQQMAFAQQELARARKEKSEPVRQVYLKEAMDKVELARTYARRVETAVGLPATDDSRYVGAAGPAPGGIQPGDSPALRQLRRSAGLSKDEKAGAAFGERDTGRLSEVTDYDPRTQTATLPNGQKINVAPIQRAVNAAGRPGQQQPLFERTEVPGGTPVWRLTPGARTALHDPAKRPAIDKVGGVDLKVTYDILSFAGVSDFRPKGPAAVVKQPVLISLRRLLDRAEPLLRTPGDWQRLPDDIRFPGGIDRLHGFVLVSGGNDLILVGDRSDTPANRISLDLLIVGFRAVWKNDSDPAVSLDAPPGGGATFTRYARVEKIPFQSRFARIMLDADYAMKHIDRLVWGRQLGEYGRKSLAIDREERPKLGKDVRLPSERQWLSPAPLSPNDLHVSGSGRTLLFAANVQRQSESERRDGASVGIVERIVQRQNALFNQYYPTFETAPEIAPRGIFRRMRGLVDIATVSRLLREAGVAASALQRLTDLPLPELTGAEVVPKTYTSFDIDHPEFLITANTGGAVIKVRSKARHYDLVQDAASRLLEQAADRLVESASVSATLALSLSVPQSTAFPEFLVDRRLQAAIDDAYAGRLAEASDKFREVTQFAPFDERGWARLGWVEAKRNRVAESNAAFAKAIALARTDPDVLRLALLAILERDFSGRADWPEEVRFEVAHDLTITARDRLARADKEGAARAAGIALTLWPDYAEAALLRALAVDDPLSDSASNARNQAIALYRKAVEADANDENRRALAFALAISVGWEMEAMVKALPRYAQVSGSSAARSKLFRETHRLLKEVAEAETNDPEHPLAPALRPRLLMLQQMLAQMAGFSGNFTESLRAAVSAVQRFPGFAEAHLSHAQLLLQVGRTEDALLALHNAVNLDPGFVNALLLRASVRAAQKQCTSAREDLDRARKVGGEIHPDVASFVDGNCR